MACSVARNVPICALYVPIEAGAVLLVEEERANYVHVRQPPASEVGWLERGQVRVVEKADERDH